MSITKRILARSVMTAIAMTAFVMVLQVSKNILIVHKGPPTLSHLAAILACYIATGFAFSVGFYLVAERLPGRSWTGKGLRYGLMVVLVVWIAGLVAMMGIDFEGGWDMASPAKTEVYWMSLCDCLNIVAGGLLVGLMARKEGIPTAASAPPSSGLAARMAVAALLLPLLYAGLFYATSLVLPIGFDLSGNRAVLFYFFIFAPIAISGLGTALFHEALRKGPGSGLAADSARVFAIVYTLYCATNDLFIPFLGFTWASLADFLAAGAPALLIVVVVLEAMARSAARANHLRRREASPAPMPSAPAS